MIFILSLILLIIVFLLLLIILFSFFFAIDVFLDLPYVATKKEKVGTIIKLANIKRGETVIDLGSGDGRLLFAAAQKGAKAIGYEINPFLIFLTKLKSQFSPPQVRDLILTKRQNLWHTDLAVADVIFVYGRKKTMPRFEKFIYQNAKRGARIIVNTDKTKPFPNKKPLKSGNGIFLYKI